MKLLFDENLSPKLPRMLTSEYPGSIHVREVGLRGHEDRGIWDHARTQGFTIVSKNTDFRDRSFVEGHPPKIIWLNVGNAGTTLIAELLQREHQRIAEFAEQEESSFLILSLGPATI